jgi:protease-4
MDIVSRKKIAENSPTNFPEKIAVEIQKTRTEKVGDFLKSFFRGILILFFLVAIFKIPGAHFPAEFQVEFVDRFGATASEIPNKKIIAQIPIDGIIAGEKSGLFDFAPAEMILKMLDFVENDAEISGVILQIDSPGGTVFDTQRIVEKIEKLREKKPVVAVLRSTAASGGYFVAAAAEKIFAFKESIVGSLGVLLQFPNAKNLMEKVGVKMIEISSGEFKTAGSPFAEFSETERAIFQKMVNSTHRDLIAQIARQRNLEIEKVAEISDGRVFSATNAAELNLIDSLAGASGAENFFTETFGEINRLQFHAPRNWWEEFSGPVATFFGGEKTKSAKFLAR